MLLNIFILPKKTIPRQTHVETQTLLQSSVTFLLLSILSVPLACALTSCCLPMCHKFIIVSSDIISSCLSAFCGSPLLDYVALTSMCAHTSFDSSCVSYPAAPLDSSLLFLNVGFWTLNWQPLTLIYINSYIHIYKWIYEYIEMKDTISILPVLQQCWQW